MPTSLSPTLSTEDLARMFGGTAQPSYWLAPLVGAPPEGEVGQRVETRFRAVEDHPYVVNAHRVDWYSEGPWVLTAVGAWRSPEGGEPIHILELPKLFSIKRAGIQFWLVEGAMQIPEAVT